jgi:ABC-2 type transport system permease protein
VSTQSNAMPESSLKSQVIAPPVNAATRPFYWSVRRELWEYRSIYIAPLAAAAVVLFGFLISMIWLPRRMPTILTLDLEKQREALVMPYHMAAGLIMGVAFVVGLYYCLDALHSERRDRSILFWKSLPVSDLTTVLSKVSVVFILQLLTFAITIATHWIMLLLSSAVLLVSGISVGSLWTQLSLPEMSLMLLYHLLMVHVLWYAPIYCWLLLVSGWARRAVLLWAVLPPLAICVVEKLAFNTLHFATLLKYRFFSEPGSMSMTADPFPIDLGAQLTPGTFLLSPGLWLGLVFAAAFLFAAVRLRRYREPI